MGWRWLLVCALVALAGCGAVFGTDTVATSETLTPAPVPETAGTATPDNESIAPGLTRTGVTDVDALVAAHRTATADRSFVWVERRGRVFGESRVSATAPVALRNRTVARVESPTVYRVRTRRNTVRLGPESVDVASYSAYADGRDRHVQYTPGDGGAGGRPAERYRTLDAVSVHESEHVGGAATSAIRNFLSVENATVSATRVGGRTRYLIRSHQPPLAGSRQIRNYTVTATVSPDGFVRSLDVSFVWVTSALPRKVRYAFAFEDVDETTVDPPAWYRNRSAGRKTDNGNRNALARMS
jgi:hypothetical protein